MNSQDPLRDLWLAQTPPGVTKGDIVEIVQSKIRRFDRNIARRNVMEYVSAAFVAAYFGFQSIRQPNVTMRIGFLVVAAAALWIIVHLIKHGRSSERIDLNQSLASYTAALAERYDQQISLLKTVKYWYLLPLYVGLLIISAGELLDRGRPPGVAWTDGIAPAIYTAIFFAIWWINEVVAVKRLRKERANLMGRESCTDN